MVINDKISYEKTNTIWNRQAATYRPYYQVKLIKMNIQQVKKYYILIKVKKTQKAQLIYSPFRNVLEKSERTKIKTNRGYSE